MFIQLLAIFGAITGFVGITLSVAAGLYYFSEIIEENTVLTKKALKISIQAIAVILLLLWIFDGFPFLLTLFTLASYYIYYLNLRKFPNVELTNPIFILSCVLALVNHYLWFQHFSNPYIPTIEERLNSDFKMPYYPSFTEVASFFGICIWLIPFSIFISISSNDGQLPMSSNDLRGDIDQERVKKGVNLVRFLITYCLTGLTNSLKLLGIDFKLGKTDPSNPNELYI